MRYLLFSLSLLATTACINENVTEEKLPDTREKTGTKSLTVFSHRHYDSDKEIFAQFEKETGIKINIKEADARELANLIEQEGEKSPADVFITSDVAALHIAESKNILTPLTHPDISRLVPDNYIHPEKLWCAVTLRSRIVVYNPTKVNPDEIKTFNELTLPKWRKRIAVRSSDNFYNQSLLSAIIVRHGEEEAFQWAKSITANMFRSPQGNDRDQIKEVAAGNADIAIVNSYYYGKMLESTNIAEVEAAQKLKLHYIQISEDGVHMNASGAGVIKSSKNKEAAEQFIAFLLRKDIQEKFAAANYEYPVNTEAAWPKLIKEWGEFTAETVNISEIGRHNNKAITIFAQAGWK